VARGSRRSASLSPYKPFSVPIARLPPRVSASDVDLLAVAAYPRPPTFSAAPLKPFTAA
jgi:hypothetical protein